MLIILIIMVVHCFGQSDNDLSQETTSIVTVVYVMKATIRR